MGTIIEDGNRQVWRIIVLVAATIIAVIGAILATDGDKYYRASAVFCPFLLLLAYGMIKEGLPLMSSALLLLLCGVFVGNADRFEDKPRLGSMLLVAGMIIAWVTVIPRINLSRNEEPKPLVAHTSGMLLVLLNLLGCVLFWISMRSDGPHFRAYAISTTAFLITFVFFAVHFLYSTHALWVLLFFGAYFQHDLLQLALDGCGDLCNAAAVVCWVAHIGFALLTIWCLPGDSASATIDKLKQASHLTRFITMAVCLLFAVMGTIIVGTENDWTNANAVFAIVALCLAFAQIEMIRAAFAVVAGGLLFASSGRIVLALHLASNHTHTFAYLCILIAMWLAFVVSIPIEEYSAAFTTNVSQRFRFCSIVVLALNLVGLIMWWTGLHKADTDATLPLSITVALNSCMFFASALIFHTAPVVLTSLFWSTFVQVLILSTTIRHDKEHAALIQFGSVLCWIAHMLMIALDYILYQTVVTKQSEVQPLLVV